MRSIRWSLIMYFLLLLAGALGATSWLVYRITARSLEEKQHTNRQLLLTRHEELRREEIARLDNDLLYHARALSNLAQSQFEANRLYPLQFLPLGLLAAGPNPYAHVLAPLWVAQIRDGRIVFLLHQAVATEVQINEDMLQPSEDRSNDFLQVHLPRGRPWRSRSLGDGSLPFDQDSFRRMKMLDWEFDDIEVNGLRLRRVRLKAPVVRTRYLPASVFAPPPVPNPLPPANRVNRTDLPRRDRWPPPGFNWPRVADATPLYIQWATDRTERDTTLEELEENTRQQLRHAEEEAAASLLRLRKQLLGISLTTFIAVCVGASLLVRLGLSPLSRLGEAVSRVSASDFQLHFDGPRPPVELAPILERMQGTLAMLRRAFDREKRATADISHELRTPLAGLMTTIDVAMRRPRAADDYRRTLADCREIVRQMSQMVDRLLTLSWLDTRSDVALREWVNMGELAEQCTAVVRPLAEAHALTLRTHIQAPVKLQTDVGKIREIISNLLHNAVEYSQPGGTIDLHVTTSEKGLELLVRDTGIGIEPEHLDRIFERFFRADPSRQATGIHAGLGLSIVRGYVELLGGTITVESELGQGSAFRVFIPSVVRETR